MSVWTWGGEQLLYLNPVTGISKGIYDIYQQYQEQPSLDPTVNLPSWSTVSSYADRAITTYETTAKAATGLGLALALVAAYFIFKK